MEEQTQSVPMCRMGCGFFGNSATEGMCSKCYRDYLTRKQQQAAQQSSTSTTATSAPTPRSEATAREETDSVFAMGGEVQATPLSDLPASPPSAASSEATPTKSSPKKNRCFVCRKKVGLTGFHCRCGNQFCALHRYADQHSCSFDYKTAGREELERKHPRVVAAKIQKL